MYCYNNNLSLIRVTLPCAGQTWTQSLNTSPGGMTAYWPSSVAHKRIHLWQLYFWAGLLHSNFNSQYKEHPIKLLFIDNISLDLFSTKKSLQMRFSILNHCKKQWTLVIEHENWIKFSYCFYNARCLLVKRMVLPSPRTTSLGPVHTWAVP